MKERVEEKAGIPPVQQRLIFGGKAMWVHVLCVCYNHVEIILSFFQVTDDVYTGETTKLSKTTKYKQALPSILSSLCVEGEHRTEIEVKEDIWRPHAYFWALKVVTSVRACQVSIYNRIGGVLGVQILLWCIVRSENE